MCVWSGIRGSGVLSSTCDVLEISVVRGVGGVCDMCMCLARGGEEGGEWMRELGLGFTNPVGTGGMLDMCLCFGGVVVVCPLQPSSSVNSGCPGPESSVLVSSRWACPISSQVTGYWGELCNRTGEVHPVDPFHSLDILKNHFASVAFCMNSGVYNVQNGAVIELSFVVSVKGFPRH